MEISRRQFLQSAAIATTAISLPEIGSCEPAGPAAETESPPIFYDADGLIVHRGNDGGDTAQREGWYWLGRWVWENKLNLLIPSGLRRTL
jgi:hypothetical protein